MNTIPSVERKSLNQEGRMYKMKAARIVAVAGHFMIDTLSLIESKATGMIKMMMMM